MERFVRYHSVTVGPASNQYHYVYHFWKKLNTQILSLILFHPQLSQYDFITDKILLMKIQIHRRKANSFDDGTFGQAV
jgi:hypothetical protein